MNILEQLEYNFSQQKRKKQKKAPYKKPESVKQLEREYTAYHYEGRDIPYQTPYKFRDDTANGLTQCICRYLEMNGYFAARVNTTGTYNVKLKKFIRSGATKGMADITSVIDGRHLSIEVKAGKDRPREDQVAIQRRVVSAGGGYIFVHSYDDFLQQFNSWRSGNEN